MQNLSFYAKTAGFAFLIIVESQDGDAERPVLASKEDNDW